MSSLLALLDDIAHIMDDIGAMTKIATKKTAGVLGDDLAVNANQVSGFSAERELPIVWAVLKGSLINKIILVPLALLLSAFFPAAIDYVLLIGGAYLGFEGAEKVWEWLTNKPAEPLNPINEPLPSLTPEDEKTKIRGAIRTDFILSIEIVVIALGVLNDLGKPLIEQVIALSFIAILLTFGVYGTVALIVKLDDIGIHWVQKHEGILDYSGRFLLWFAPKLLHALTYIGTIAMFAVAGGIWAEHLTPLEQILEPVHHTITHHMGNIGGYGLHIIIGIIVGFIALAILAPIHHFIGHKQHD